MPADLIHDRGRGPEIVGTRITVYNLLPYFLDPTATEAHICRMCALRPEQVAAARAYVLNNPDTVLAKHLELEARMNAGNQPDVIEQAKRTHAAFLRFKDSLAKQQAETPQEISNLATKPSASGIDTVPAFREWVAEKESRSAEGD